MSDHFDASGASNPDGDARVDITDHYVFRKPEDASKTIFVLNVNSPATAASDFRAGAVYETLIDTNDDAVGDVTFQYRFTARDLTTGEQFADVDRVDAAGSVRLLTGAPVSFGETANITDGSDGVRFFAGLRSDPFFFDAIAFLADMSFQDPGKDFFADKNVDAIVLEVPNSMLGGNPHVRVWTRTLIPATYNPSELMIADQAGRPLITTFYVDRSDYMTFNQTEPANQRDATTSSGSTFLESFTAVLMKWGYKRQRARAIARQLLPDAQPFDYSKKTGFPNGRMLRDDTPDCMLNQLTNGQKPSDYVGPHDDYLDEFPYLGRPH